MDLYRKEIAYATEAHGDQKRKWTGQPYVTHPIAVSKILEAIGAPMTVVRAGIFHDLIEDTSVTKEMIEDRWGLLVSEYVVEVTNVSKPEHGDRQVRKALDTHHIHKASYWGQTIKLADIIDNTRTIVSLDPVFAKQYLEEKSIVLKFMNNCNHTLKMYAEDVLRLSLKVLEKDKS